MESKKAVILQEWGGGRLFFICNVFCCCHCSSFNSQPQSPALSPHKTGPISNQSRKGAGLTVLYSGPLNLIESGRRALHCLAMCPLPSPLWSDSKAVVTRTTMVNLRVSKIKMDGHECKKDIGC